ncbi:MAG: enoyl-CoA hydratase [Gemmataceae bacterium]|nr:enoyl-CoA hydratase [Gemmataceae bacterium]
MEVIRSDRDGIATLTLNRPEKRNAISPAMIQSLQGHLESIREDSSVRVIFLTGMGKTFCAGMDLERVQQVVESAQGMEVPWQDTIALEKVFGILFTLPQPTVALVNGPAVAGGAGLVSLCDLALAVPAARFGYPEVRRGLVAALVLPHLLRLVGERQARFLLLTGELLTAEEAWRIGLINAVVKEEELVETGNRLAASLMQGGPRALAKTKELLREIRSNPGGEFGGSHAPVLTQESLQGLRAFFSKQDPPWAKKP